MFSKPRQKLGSQYSWAVVGMLWLVCVLNYADRQVISAIFPALEQEFGFSKFQLGLIGSMFMWVYAGTAFFAGFMSDRLSRKPLILGGLFFWSLIAMATGWCTSFAQFLSLRALEGAGESFYFPASNSLIADYHSPRNRSAVLACHQSGMYVGIIMGSSLGAWLAQHYGWSYGFYFFGGAGILLSLILFLFLKEPMPFLRQKEKDCREKKITLGATVHHLLSHPPVLLLTLAFIGAHFVSAIFLIWMPLFFYEKFHLSLAAAACSAVIFIQLAGLLSALCNGWLADGMARIFPHGRVLLQAIYLLFGAGMIVFIGQTTTMATLIVTMLVFGFCKGGYDSGVFATLFDYIHPTMRGSASGLILSLGWLGGALGPSLVGLIVTYGGASNTALHRMSVAISASSLAYLLAALLLLSILRMPSQLKKQLSS